MKILKDCHLEDFHLLNLIDFDGFCSQIKNYCCEYDFECCGIATSKNLYFLENIHPAKNLFFQIDPQKYFNIVSKENVLFIWHSHVFGSADPSDCDVEYAYDHQHSSLIYSVQDKNFCFFRVDPFKSVYFSI